MVKTTKEATYIDQYLAPGSEALEHTDYLKKYISCLLLTTVDAGVLRRTRGQWPQEGLRMWKMHLLQPQPQIMCF